MAQVSLSALKRERETPPRTKIGSTSIEQRIHSSFRVFNRQAHQRLGYGVNPSSSSSSSSKSSSSGSSSRSGMSSSSSSSSSSGSSSSIIIIIIIIIISSSGRQQQLKETQKEKGLTRIYKLTKCIAYVNLSALKKERETAPKTKIDST